MDTDDAPAGGTGPLPPLALQKSIHTRFPDAPQILQRGFADRVLRPVPDFLFHDVSARKIRTFITERIPVYLPLFTQDDTASRRTELGFVVIWAAASGTGAGLGQRSLADAAVQPTRGDHIRVEHSFQTSSLVRNGLSAIHDLTFTTVGEALDLIFQSAFLILATGLDIR